LQFALIDENVQLTELKAALDVLMPDEWWKSYQGEERTVGYHANQLPPLCGVYGVALTMHAEGARWIPSQHGFIKTSLRFFWLTWLLLFVRGLLRS
jgi:hypothetical protein